MVKKIITFLIGLIIVINFTIVIVPRSSKAAVPPLLFFEWCEGQEVQEAEVAPGGNNLVVFLGIVRFNYPTDGPATIVNLSAISDQVWNTSISPSQIIFPVGSTGDIPFYVTVKVPYNTSYYTQGMINVSGNATIYTFYGNYTYKLQDIFGTIKITQFYSFKINSDVSMLKIDNSNEEIYNLNLTNTGNGNDSFILNIKNEDELKESELKIEYPHEIKLMANETKTIQLIIKKSDSTKPGIYDLKLSVESTQEKFNEDYSSSKSFTVNQRARTTSHRSHGAIGGFAIDWWHARLTSLASAGTLYGG